MTTKIAYWPCAILVFALSAGGPPAQAADPVDFVREVKPILESACVNCHGPEKPKGDLRLDTRAGALKGGETGPSLVPGKPAESTIYTLTILPPDDDKIMPPKGQPLTKAQTEILRRWISEGATWRDDILLKAVKRVDFAKDVQPILEFNCVSCHRDGNAKGSLRLDNAADAFKGGDGGLAIVPGNSGKSLLFTSTILPADHDDLMPPRNKGGPLSTNLTDVLRDWIDQGAIWPETLRLLARKPEEAQGLDESVIVAEIYRKIVAAGADTTPEQMRRYTQKIPGTTVEFEMVPIPGGEFLMGSPPDAFGHKPDETPAHRVQLEPFWMGKCEVTWNEYELFMYPEEPRRPAPVMAALSHETVTDAVTRPTKPYVEMSFGMGKDGYPAISMTQHAANKYCEWLSAQTGQFYRLPTEAEWEYACRAGTTSAYSFGDDPKLLEEYAWYARNSDWRYQKVGMKKPNPWGLHDMHGNVVEWCLDQYDPNFYRQLTNAINHHPWNRVTQPYPHAVRGGSWDDENPADLRSAARRGSTRDWKIQDPQLPKSVWYHTDAKFLGFRVVRPLRVPAPEEMTKYWTSGVEKD